MSPGIYVQRRMSTGIGKCIVNCISYVIWMSHGCPMDVYNADLGLRLDVHWMSLCWNEWTFIHKRTSIGSPLPYMDAGIVIHSVVSP